MQTYTVSQWLLFFFIYCFMGWVWESCYVSAKSGKWVNRGFLHGPALPIYGSGAIVILVSTIGVRVKGDLVKAGEFDKIKEMTAEAVALVKEIRSK